MGTPRSLLYSPRTDPCHGLLNGCALLLKEGRNTMRLLRKPSCEKSFVGRLKKCPYFCCLPTRARTKFLPIRFTLSCSSHHTPFAHNANPA